MAVNVSRGKGRRTHERFKADVAVGSDGQAGFSISLSAEGQKWISIHFPAKDAESLRGLIKIVDELGPSEGLEALNKAFAEGRIKPIGRVRKAAPR